MRWPFVRRSRLDAATATTGLYRCGRCRRFIPVGFAHRRDHRGGPCVVVYYEERTA